MARLVVVVGTATEVGKTYVTCAMAQAARTRGERVAVRKPVQSFEPDQSSATDAHLLAAASGEPLEDVCPSYRWYPLAMAPPMAADALGGDEIRMEDLVGELEWPADATLRMVETVGGVRSPIAHDADSADLAHRLRPDHAVLVSDAELGTINATRLCLDALQPLQVVVVLNRFGAAIDLHRRNREWLERQVGCQVVTDGPAAIEALFRP
jgi:dethiobiotin synthetase